MMDEPFDEDAPLLDGGEELPPDVFRHAEPEPGFRDRLLARTAAQVRNRVRVRRFLTAGAVAATYLVGVWSGLGLRPAPATENAAAAPAPLVSTSTTPQVANGEIEAPSLPLLQDTEALARKLAALAPKERTAFLKLAGDRYLNDLDDMTLALSCYRQMLSKLPDSEVAKPQPNDTWLLSMLKQARTEETSHEKPQV